MDKRIVKSWVSLVTGVTMLAIVCYSVATVEWTWSNVVLATVLVVCGVVLTAGGLRR